MTSRGTFKTDDLNGDSDPWSTQLCFVYFELEGRVCDAKIWYDRWGRWDAKQYEKGYSGELLSLGLVWIFLFRCVRRGDALGRVFGRNNWTSIASNLGIIVAKAIATSKKAMTSGLIYLVTLNLDGGRYTGKIDNRKASNPPATSREKTIHWRPLTRKPIGWLWFWCLRLRRLLLCVRGIVTCYLDCKMHRYIQDEQIVVQGAVKLQIIHNIHALNVTWLLTNKPWKVL